LSRAIRFDIPRHILEREAAKRTDRIIQLVCGSVAVLCLVGAALLVPSINEARKEHQLVIDPDSLQNIPPDIELLTKMGTFRALAIDIAFIRLERLKQEDKFFELMQLSEWLCKLAPRYPSIWQYAAWNQAYNISVAQYAPEARWKWVNNGIHILRDQGIQYNPKSIGLYKELAWTYWHKIGDFLDDHHWEYKMELAVEMERVLGAPEVALTEAETLDAFRKIAEAPRDLDALLREDAEAAALVRKLHTVGLEADDALLEFVARYTRNDIQIVSLLKIDENDTVQQRLLERARVVTDPACAAALDRLLAVLRANVLRTRYHMDPEYMLELMEEYGPLDWRLASSMSLYWSALGDKVTKGQISLNPNESMNTVRLIFFSLDNMVRRGRLVLEPNFDKPNASFFQLLPDHRFIRHTQEAMLKYGEEQIDDPNLARADGYPILVNFRPGHVSFLRSSIRQLWWLGTPEARAEAREYYAWLRKYDREPDGRVKVFYEQPIDRMVIADIYQGLTSFKNAQTLVNNFLRQSLDQLAIGDLQAAQGYLDVARQSWEYYMSDKSNDIVERRRIPPLELMRRRATMDYLRRSDVPLLNKVRLWRRLDLRSRHYTYDSILPYMTRLCDKNVPPLDLNEVFRKPPGMEEFREETQQEEDKPTKPEIERGEKVPR